MPTGNWSALNFPTDRQLRRLAFPWKRHRVIKQGVCPLQFERQLQPLLGEISEYLSVLALFGSFGQLLTMQCALTTLFWIARHDTLPRRALQGIISVVFDVNQY